jgi:hypothetical protein
VTDARRSTTACNSGTARTTILCGEGAAFQHRRHQRVFALLCAVLCGWRHRPPHADNNDNNVESTFLIGRGARMSLLCSQGGINSVGVAFRWTACNTVSAQPTILCGEGICFSTTATPTCLWHYFVQSATCRSRQCVSNTAYPAGIPRREQHCW